VCLGTVTTSGNELTPSRLTFTTVFFFSLHCLSFADLSLLGSIDAIDCRLEGYDAIVCSEVIEHVYNDVLDKFFATTLGHYQPNILIVTTPNGEYNVHFPDLKYGTSEATFRHDDHKFEWTRQQFETWCHQGASQYGYSIEFLGIGLLNSKLSDTTHGHCTQACIFVRNKEKRPSVIAGQPHTLLKHIEFPYYDDPPLQEEEMRQEIETYIEKLCIAEDYYRKQSVCVKPPTIDEESEDEQEAKEGLCWTLDWGTDDSSTLDLMPATPQVQYTMSPIQLPISCLWDVLRLRQICRTKQRLVDLLDSFDLNQYEVVGDDLVITRAFLIPTETYSSSLSSSLSSEEEM
jgi:hypothetical protein